MPVGGGTTRRLHGTTDGSRTGTDHRRAKSQVKSDVVGASGGVQPQAG